MCLWTSSRITACPTYSGYCLQENSREILVLANLTPVLDLCQCYFSITTGEVDTVLQQQTKCCMHLTFTVVSSVVVRNSTGCVLLFAVSSCLSPLHGTNMFTADCQLYYLHISWQAHGVQPSTCALHSTNNENCHFTFRSYLLRGISHFVVNISHIFPTSTTVIFITWHTGMISSPLTQISSVPNR